MVELPYRVELDQPGNSYICSYSVYLPMRILLLISGNNNDEASIDDKTEYCAICHQLRQ